MSKDNFKKYMGLFDFLLKNRRKPTEDSAKTSTGDPDKEEYERILRHCEQSLVLNDIDPYFWNKKCLVLIKLRRYEEAIKAGKIAVQLAPNDPELWDTLSSAYSVDGNQQKADECQNIALDLNRPKKEAERQRLKQISSRKVCWSCGEYISEIIQCGPCGGYYCTKCWQKHQWSHGKAPAIGIEYRSDGSFSGFDGSERIKKDK